LEKSKCGPCGHDAFELETIEAGAAKTRVSVLQCARCGAVIGVADGGTVRTSLQLQEGKIDAITHQVQRIDAGLRAIVEALNRR
jgi:hypothetical protein